MKKKTKYQKRRWEGHGYGTRTSRALLYLLQGYYFCHGIEGKKVNPSRGRLAKEIGTSIKTLQKAFDFLKKIGDLEWISGKKTWETNSYILSERLKTTPLSHPGEGFKHPKHIYHKLKIQEKKKRFKNLWTVIREHRLKDITHHMFHIREKIAKEKGGFFFKEKSEEELLKSGGYDSSRLEAMLDIAEGRIVSKKANFLPIESPIELIETFGRYGFKEELSSAMNHQKTKVIKIFENSKSQVEKILSHIRRKKSLNFRLRNFWGFFNHLSVNEDVGFFSMKLRVLKDALEGKSTKLDCGVDSSFVVDSLREKEKKYKEKVSDNLLKKILLKGMHFSKIALEALDYRLKLKKVVVNSPFGLFSSILGLQSVEEIKLNFFTKKQCCHR